MRADGGQDEGSRQPQSRLVGKKGMCLSKPENKGRATQRDSKGSSIDKAVHLETP